MAGEKMGSHFGTPAIRALLYGIYIRAPDYWKLPYDTVAMLGIWDQYTGSWYLLRPQHWQLVVVGISKDANGPLGCKLPS